MRTYRILLGRVLINAQIAAAYVAFTLRLRCGYARSAMEHSGA